MKKPLELYGTNELIAELERRNQIEKKPPDPLAIIDFAPITKICTAYVNYVSSDEYHEDNDYENYIYETVLTTIYGDTFWDWLNKIIK